jgi:proteasome lid subunit RPN8/RPN11
MAWQDLPVEDELPIVARDEWLARLGLATADAPSDQPVVVYLQPEALAAVFTHLEADCSREHGGILFGRPSRDVNSGWLVEVTRALPAPASAGNGAYLRFTGASWQPTWDHAAAHADERIVGWYHSHPGLGVFLSPTDRRTHAHHFPHPWQLALVVDPVRVTSGWFGGDKAGAIDAVLVLTEQARNA